MPNVKCQTKKKILAFEIDIGAGFSHLNLPFRDLTP
jgi:hypothetical protein